MRSLIQIVYEKVHKILTQDNRSRINNAKWQILGFKKIGRFLRILSLHSEFYWNI
jgi:hypothetical protein